MARARARARARAVARARARARDKVNLFPISIYLCLVKRGMPS